MESYAFEEFHTTKYEVDPVFKTKDYRIFGDVFRPSDPVLFCVTYEKKEYWYCLIKQDDCAKNEDLLLKIKRYILVLEDGKKSYTESTVFVIGDVRLGAEASGAFVDGKVAIIDYSTIEEWYPKRLEDIFRIAIKHILINQKHLGQMHNLSSIDDDFLFVDPNLEEGQKDTYRKYILNSMAREGYVSLFDDVMFKFNFVLTPKGISLVEEKEESQSKVCFIAIKFNDNQERINAIYKAIEKAGFEPRIMNRYETNNWIMPEVFFQIENSRFVVADFSLPCDGAYYEAGYAAALKKPVIHLFDKREERGDNTLHFDISQKSTIFYDDYEDLEKRLVDRIIATIR